MELITERLILRPCTEADAEDLYAYAKDPRVGLAAGWRPHDSLEMTRERIRSALEAPDDFALADKDSGRLIGTAGFTGRHRKELPGPDDEIGYSLHPDYWGRGLMPEAVRALLRYGFEELGLRTIWCSHYDGNQKSKRVVLKCGFRYRFLRMQQIPDLGETRLALVYAVTKEEWRRQRGCAGDGASDPAALAGE